MARCAIVSFRLGLSDGVSVVAATWARAMTSFGFDVVTVAGDGPVDRLLPALAMQPQCEPVETDVVAALDDADLVIVENLCTIPLNLPAARAVAKTLRGRPAVLHHHDPPWQRPHFADVTELPPTDPMWQHVTINDLTRREFAARGIDATVIYNGFDPDPPKGDRDKTREILDVDTDERLLAHPVRDPPQERPGRAPAGRGHRGDVLARRSRRARLRRRARGRARTSAVSRHPPDGAGQHVRRLRRRRRHRVSVDVEGFGNPPIEAALHRRPAAVGHYPVADELRAFGFEWFDPEAATELDRFLDHPDEALLERNRRVAVEHFSFDRMASSLRAMLDDAGWLP